MGKFPHSKIHEAFSNWHYRKCKPNAYLCDIDRIWVELRKGVPVAVFDLKTEGDKLTEAGATLGKWFELVNVPFYVVSIRIIDIGSDKAIRKFTVWRPETDNLKTLSEEQMIAWINQDLSVKFFQSLS